MNFNPFLILMLIGKLGFTQSTSVLCKDTTLKAVLIVAYQEDATDDAIAEMKKIENYLLENKVKVKHFYTHECNWTQIKKESYNTDFFIYCGHGSNLGGNGSVGGLILNTRVTSKQIIEELKFNNKPIIIFKSVCNGAGSSAGDNEDIGIEEAVKRVKSYSDPFFSIGAKIYLANDRNGAITQFFKYFFQGLPISECYNKLNGTYNLVEYFNELADGSFLAVSSNKSQGITTRISYVNGRKKVTTFPSIKSYSSAYRGNPNLKIER